MKIFLRLCLCFTALLASASVEISSHGGQLEALREQFAAGTEVTITFLPGDNFRANADMATKQATNARETEKKIAGPSTKNVSMDLAWELPPTIWSATRRNSLRSLMIF